VAVLRIVLMLLPVPIWEEHPMNRCGWWTLDDLVEAYKQHQRRTRGLRDRTLSGYERHVREFVRGALGDDPIDPSELGCAEVVEFVALMTGRYSPASMKGVRTALRSFLRYLRGEGFLPDQRLEDAIPRLAHWRLSTLPRSLSDQQLRRVLESLDEVASPCGPRDRAIVRLLAGLGLRPGEVAELHLEDIDWHGGSVELRLRKNRRGAVLPLSHEAGRAIAVYLGEHRPETVERRVFVKQTGPERGQPITPTAISEVVARALRRAGVVAPMQGAYVFRHTVASQLVQHGASLKEVADVLGHRDLDSASIYAKVDLPALRDVALPWPEADR
jgi:integrase/recombinase XerD